MGNILVIPSTEGINHINACSHSRTELGKMLSNFYHSPFIHQEYGKFECMEGYWFYISTGFKHEELRKLVGYEAKKYGESLQSENNSNFFNDIFDGLVSKISQNEDLLNKCRENDLPYYHYYVYDGRSIKIDEDLFTVALRKAIQHCIIFC